MRAAVVRTLPSLEPELADIDTPDPAPGELLVRVEACGICGTDLHIPRASPTGRPCRSSSATRVSARLSQQDHPRTSTGSVGVSRRPSSKGPGRRVLCRAGNGPCLSGNERLCPTIRSVIGISQRNGAFADFVAVRASARDPGAGLARVPPGGRARGCGRHGGQHRRGSGARGHWSGGRRRRGPGRLLRDGATTA